MLNRDLHITLTLYLKHYYSAAIVMSQSQNNHTQILFVGLSYQSGKSCKIISLCHFHVKLADISFVNVQGVKA